MVMAIPHGIGEAIQSPGTQAAVADAAPQRDAAAAQGLAEAAGSAAAAIGAFTAAPAVRRARRRSGVAHRRHHDGRPADGEHAARPAAPTRRGAAGRRRRAGGPARLTAARVAGAVRPAGRRRPPSRRARRRDPGRCARPSVPRRGSPSRRAIGIDDQVVERVRALDLGRPERAERLEHQRDVDGPGEHRGQAVGAGRRRGCASWKRRFASLRRRTPSIVATSTCVTHGAELVGGVDERAELLVRDPRRRRSSTA